MLINANVQAFLGEAYIRTGHGWNDYKHVPYNHLSNIKPDDTVVLVFSEGQEKYLETVLTDKSIKVLFKGDKAVNGNYPKTTPPRNTIVVIEKADETETQSVSEVS